MLRAIMRAAWKSVFLVAIIVACGPLSGKMESTSSEKASSQSAAEQDGKDSEDQTDNGLTAESSGEPESPAADAPVNNPDDQLKVDNPYPSGPALTYEEKVGDSLVDIQVKNPDLIRASLDSCFGNDSNTILKSDMFAVHNFLSIQDELDFVESGRRQFLSALSPYMALVKTAGGSGNSNGVVEFVTPDSPDVLILEASNLADPQGTARSVAAVDSLSDRYLRSLESVGQVVAHNCSLSRPNCQCDSVEKARAMIQRCLPLVAINQEQLVDLSALMSKACSEGALGTRKAIASMISSYAFAVRR